MLCVCRTRNTNAGTPNYMAPELLDCRPFNKSVDVYAFGIVLYEVGTRRPLMPGPPMTRRQSHT